MTDFLFSDHLEKVLVWIGVFLFCILCWVQVIKFIAHQVEERQELRREIQQIRDDLKTSSTIMIDGKEIRYE